VDGARLSGAKLRVFRHNDLDDLEDILKWTNASRGKAQATSARARVLIITESIFSMDGDHAPLREIVELKDKYGAWLMLDEAHGTGLYGHHRRGLAEELSVSDRIEIQMGTLGKAIGASGGFICGSRKLIDYLINRARTFVFSTAPVPAAAAAAAAGVRFVQSEGGEQRRARLWENWETLRVRLSSQLGAPDTVSATHRSTIIPTMIGDEQKAVEVASALRDKNIFIPAIRYPTVARGEARLRITITAGHTRSDLDELFAALATLDFRLQTSDFT
jgi:7-keto-8-aminopelargonate synthetase-like enzyme